MKRKIALLLAGALAFSAAPTTLFAATGNQLSYPNRPVKEKTLFYEQGVLGYNATGDFSNYDKKNDDVKFARSNDYLEAYVDGTDLVIEVKNNVARGTSFEVSLSNADWFFRNYSPDKGTTGSGIGTAQKQLLTPDQELRAAQLAYLATYDYAGNTGTSPNTSEVALRAAGYSYGEMSPQATNYLNRLYTVYDHNDNTLNLNNVVSTIGIEDLVSREKFGEGKSTASQPDWAKDSSGNDVVGKYLQTYDYNNGLYISDSSNSARGAYLRFPVADTKSKYGEREVPYLMMISSTGIGSPNGYTEGRAVVELTDAAERDDVIVIPLVTRTGTGEVAKVSIANGSSAVNGETLSFGVTNGSGTYAYVLDEDREAEVSQARDDFNIPFFVVMEKQPNTLKSGTFILTAPEGYEFDLNGLPNNGSNGGEGAIRVLLEGLDWSGRGVNAGEAYGEYGVDWTIDFTRDRRSNSKDDDEDSYVNFNEIYVTADINPGRLGSTQGKLVIENLKLLAIDDPSDTVTNVNVKIKEKPDTLYRVGDNKYDSDSFGKAYGAKMKVTTQDVKVAERTDWNITMTAKDPTVLVNGTYEDNLDEHHQAARVTFKENVSSSWWSGRVTEFTLPEGVKFRKVEILNTENISESEKDDIEKELFPSSKGTSSSTARAFLEDTKLTLRNIATTKDKKVKFEIDSWLSIESGFTGDIALSCDTYGKDEIKPVVIAKAVNPIKIDTKVTEVKIGYQYYPVADFTITETEAGRLRRNKEIRIAVSDLITTDMHFTTGIKHEITAGDMKIKNVKIGSTDGSYDTGLYTVNSAGVISFDIDRVSSKGKPSSVKFSNVQLKIDRTVPETAGPNSPSPKPYQLIVWGSAIAENFGKNEGKVHDKFGTPGIMTDYVKVISSANDRTSVLTQEVKVTIGERYFTVGDKQVDMDAAAYISTASNSTMVPVRFISYAFGLEKEQVLWDDANHRVTILHPIGRTVQFEEKSSNMKVDGMDVTMLSPDGLAVTPEIRDDRMYVPFRAMGSAFGVTTTWDAETQAAVYSPSGYSQDI